MTNRDQAMAHPLIAVNSADAAVGKVSDENKDIGISSKRLMPFSSYEMASIESRHPREHLKNKVDASLKAHAGCDDDAR